MMTTRNSSAKWRKSWLGKGFYSIEYGVCTWVSSSVYCGGYDVLAFTGKNFVWAYSLEVILKISGYDILSMYSIHLFYSFLFVLSGFWFILIPVCCLLRTPEYMYGTLVPITSVNVH